MPTQPSPCHRPPSRGGWGPLPPLPGVLRTHLLSHLGRKFPNIDEQLESPSIRLLEKKKEAKIMHRAMEQKKEVGTQECSAGRALLEPPSSWVAVAGVGGSWVKLLCSLWGEKKDLSLGGSRVLGCPALKPG